MKIKLKVILTLLVYPIFLLVLVLNTPGVFSLVSKNKNMLTRTQNNVYVPLFPYGTELLEANVAYNAIVGIYTAVHGVPDLNTQINNIKTSVTNSFQTVISEQTMSQLLNIIGDLKTPLTADEAGETFTFASDVYNLIQEIGMNADRNVLTDVQREKIGTTYAQFLKLFRCRLTFESRNLKYFIISESNSSYELRGLMFISKEFVQYRGVE